MRVVSATGPHVAACCVAARRLLGLNYREAQEILRSSEEGGLHRVHLATGDIVECTIVRHGRTEAFVLC